MKIQVFGSSSNGNCYRISDGQTALLIECGLPIKKIKAACDYNLSEISGCIVTHEHKDHALAANDLMKTGIDVYMTEGTAAKSDAQTYRLRLWHRRWEDSIGNPFYRSERIGTFTVKPYMAHHDAAEPVFYLITSNATYEKLLFVTDSYYIDYYFDGLTYIMVEANYSKDSLNEPENDKRRNRLRHSHMSIENCINMLKANDLSNVKEIWLIHLSRDNADAEDFKRQVQEATGCVVHVA